MANSWELFTTLFGEFIYSHRYHTYIYAIILQFNFPHNFDVFPEAHSLFLEAQWTFIFLCPTNRQFQPDTAKLWHQLSHLKHILYLLNDPTNLYYPIRKSITSFISYIQIAINSSFRLWHYPHQREGAKNFPSKRAILINSSCYTHYNLISSLISNEKTPFFMSFLYPAIYSSFLLSAVYKV